MDKLPMTQIMDIVIALVGVYSLVITLKMKSSMTIHKNILAPEEQKKCKDTAGFINQVFLPMVLFSVVVIICGGIGLVMAILQITNRIVDFSILGVFLVVFFLYATALRKAREKFVNL